MRQPCPTRSWPPITQSIGMKTFSPRTGPFGNEDPAGKCCRPMSMPGMVGGNERERDADVLAAPELVIRVQEMEREADKGGLGSKGNIALIEIQPDPEDFLAVMGAHGDDAHIAHRGGVRAGNRACQSETGDLLALRKRLQIAFLLLVGAESFDQFARAERIRHHDHD